MQTKTIRRVNKSKPLLPTTFIYILKVAHCAQSF